MPREKKSVEAKQSKPRTDVLRVWREKFGQFVWRLRDMRPAYLSTNDRVLFAKRLAFLISGEVPLLESLRMMREQAKAQKFIRVLDVIISDVSNGKQVSESLKKFPGMFDNFAINIIKVGETSGILSQNLTYLADELKKKQVLRGKVVGSLLYPALVTVATLSITIFLTVYLFPKIMPVFLSLNIKLPLSTRIVIAVSVFLRKWGIHLLVGTALFATLVTIANRRIRPFRMGFERVLLRLPIVGTMVEYYNLANFSRTLGLLLKSGVTLSNSLMIGAETSGNLVYKNQFIAMGEAINRGETLATYLRNHPHFFSEILPQMVAVGERSGNLASALLYLSDYYEREVDEFSKSLASLIEPFLMIGMGVLVGFIAISIITPIYGITQNLHP
jgi:type IV pilus assembly protein PilC